MTDKLYINKRNADWIKAAGAWDDETMTVYPAWVALRPSEPISDTFSPAEGKDTREDSEAV